LEKLEISEEADIAPVVTGDKEVTVGASVDSAEVRAVSASGEDSLNVPSELDNLGVGSTTGVLSEVIFEAEAPEQKEMFPVTPEFLYHRDACMKLLWYCKIKNRSAFKEAFRYMLNKPTLDASKKLQTTQDTMMNLDLGFDHFIEVFVKDTFLFLSTTDNLAY